jgi:hypothetical protein
MSLLSTSRKGRFVLAAATVAAVAVLVLAAGGTAAAQQGEQGPPSEDDRLVVCPPGDQHPRCEYTDIQNAVDNASSGDTVFVSAGEYHPDAAITVSNTSDITIAGAGRDETFLYGPAHHAHDGHDHGGQSAAGGGGTAAPMYHEGEAHNPFEDPEGFAEYVANNPVTWAEDHANNPVERGTTHAEQAQRFVANETDEGDDHHGEEYDAVFVTADNVTVRDLHVEGYNGNGIYYDGVRDFRVARVDTVDNGAYGIYAIRSTMGVFEDSYASGHYDSGFYLGEVTRCDCVIRNVTAEKNLLGYSGTGAGFITIEDSVWRDNAAGIVPNVLPNEPELQVHTHIEDNVIVNNNNQTAFEQWHFAGSLHAPVGSGVIIGGGSYNTIADNDIRNHSRAGVAITYMFTQPSGNAVVENRFEDNALEVWWDGGGANNCFSDNTAADGSIDYDAGAYWNAQGDLPECTNDDYATPPDPEQLAEIGTVVVFGCEFQDAPTGQNCHVEEPSPHVHPPQNPAPTSTSYEAMFAGGSDRLEAVRGALAE